MSSKPLLLLLLGAASLACAGVSIGACVGDDGVPPDTTVADSGAEAAPTTTPPATLKANGTTCTVANQCTSGICADGVCCDQKCDGICEKCSLSGTVGVCTAIPQGQDPDLECPTIPLPSDTTDAGATDAGDDGGVDAGDDDAAVVDSGPQFNVPDGGLPATNATQCAGSCNGKRACAFPDSTTQCGTAFCGDSTEEGVASCDGAGHCLYGIEECSAYTCPNGDPGCKTSCAADTDCLTGFYCDGTSHTCLAKLANGTGCTTLTQCQSSVCDTTAKVCCNVDCSSTPGGTCAHAGNIGTCVCNACPTGACGLFYPDVDNDGYGDVTATGQNGRAVYGCVGGTPPAGYVVDNTDCFDSSTPIAFSVNPGQTGYFDSAYTNGQGQPSFDYDCSGTEDKGTPDNENTCYTCFEETIKEGLVVKEPPIGFERCISSTGCGSVGEAAGHSCGSGCVPNNTQVFYAPTACGQEGTLTYCDACTSTASGPTPVYANTQTKMACH